MVGIGLEDVGNLDARGDFVERGQLERHAGQERRAAQSGPDWVTHLADGAVQHVGVDLAPDVRLRPAADHVERVQPALAEGFHAFQQPADIESHAFENRPHEIAAVVIQ